MTTIKIRTREYTPEPYTEREVLRFTKDASAYLQEEGDEALLRVCNFLLLVFPGLEQAGWVTRDRLLLGAPEVMNLALKLTKYLVATPEYKAALSELKDLGNPAIAEAVSGLEEGLESSLQEAATVFVGRVMTIENEVPAGAFGTQIPGFVDPPLPPAAIAQTAGQGFGKAIQGGVEEVSEGAIVTSDYFKAYEMAVE